MTWNNLDSYNTLVLKRDLINKFNVKKTNDLPQVKSVTLSFSCPEQKLLNVSTACLALKLIAGNSGVSLCRCKKKTLGAGYLSNFPSGVCVTLKRKRADEFLFYLVNEVIPRSSKKKAVLLPVTQSGSSSVTFSVKDIFSFEDLETNFLIFQETPPLTVSVAFKNSAGKVEKDYILRSLKLGNFVDK